MLIPSEVASSSPTGANVKPVPKGQPVGLGDHGLSGLIPCTGLRAGVGLVVTQVGGHFSYQSADTALGLREQGVGNQTDSCSALPLGLGAS